MGFHKGFSIGISDVTPSEVLRKLKHDILLEGFKKVSLLGLACPIFPHVLFLLPHFSLSQ